MARKVGKKQMVRSLVDSIYQSAIRDQQAQMQAQQAQFKPVVTDSGLTRSDIDRIYNSAIADMNKPTPHTSAQEIPKLEDNSLPSVGNPTIASELERMQKMKAENKPRSESEQRAIDTYLADLQRASVPGYKPDYQAEIERMNTLANDTATNWSEGEVNARNDYLARLQNALAEEQRKNAIVSNPVVKRSSKPSQKKTTSELVDGNVEEKKEQKNFTRTMSANEQRDLERAISAVSKAYEKEAIKETQPKYDEKGFLINDRKNEPISTANTAEFLARGKAEKQIYEKAQQKENYEYLSEEGKHKVDELNFKKAVLVADEKKPKNYTKRIKKLESSIENVYESDPGIAEKINADNGASEIEYDERGFQKNKPYGSVNDIFRKYNIPTESWNEIGDEIADYNAWRGSQSDLSGVNPIASIVSNNIGKKIQDKYGIDENTLSQLANDYKSYRSTREGVAKAKKAELFGKEHPLMGSVGSLGTGFMGGVFAPTQIADDLTNYVYNGQQTSPYEGAHLLSQKKNAYREGVKENIDSNLLKGAYDIGMGLGDLGVAAIPSMLGAPVSAPAFLAMQTANNTSTSALERGSNPIQASAYAVASAVPDYILNTIGLEKAKDLAMDRVAVDGIAKFLVQNGIAGSYEAAENVIQEGIQIAFDELINGKNSESRVSYANRIANGEDQKEALLNVVKERALQVAMSGLTGFAMGSAMQAGKTASNSFKHMIDAVLFDRLLDENGNHFYEGFNNWKAEKDIPAVEENLPDQDVNNNEVKPLDNSVPEVNNQPTSEVSDSNVENEIPTKVQEIPSNAENNTESASNQQDIPTVEEADNRTAAIRAADDTARLTVDLNKRQADVPKVEEGSESKKGFVKDGMRRVITNSAVNADIITAEDIANDPELQRIANYEKHNNIHTYKQAKRNVDENGEQLKQDYIDGKRKINSDIDVDQGMIILKQIANDIDVVDNPTELIAQRNAILRNMAENGTDAGQFIQAFAKYTNTPEYLLLSATKLDVENTNRFKSRNIKARESNSRIAEELEGMENKQSVPKDEKVKNARIAKALAEMGYKHGEEGGEKVPKTHEEIKKSVIEELDREYGSISDKFTDTDIEYLTILAENKDIPIWKITDEIEHRLNHGTWYTLDESTAESIEYSKKMAKALDAVVGGKQLVNAPENKEPESIYETMKKIRNTFEKEPSSIYEGFGDDDYYYLANLFHEKVPSWKIEDELQHRLEHGKWYTLDESLPEKAVKNQQLSNMLNNIVNGKQNVSNKKEQTTGELLTGIKNTLNDESLGVAEKFNDADYYFIGKMIEEGVPRWQIEDELKHKLEHGTWYSLDESTDLPKRTSGKLENALNRLVNEETPKVQEEKTIQDFREEVRNTINKEPAGTFDDFTDADVDYLANMMYMGATVDEIASALNTRAATGRWGISTEKQDRINEIFDYIRQFDDDSQEFVEGYAEACRLLAEDVAPKATALEKFDAWRYMAMLGNPKTMLRNWVGNKLFSVVTGLSNNLAAAMEIGTDKIYHGLTGKNIQRTKAFINPFKDHDFIKAAKDDAFGKRFRQIEGSKYEKSTKDAILQARETFDSKPMQLLEKAVDAGISDTNAVANKYATSLAGYLKANGYDAKVFDLQNEYDALSRAGRNRDLLPEEKARMESLQDTIDFLEDARDYAVKQAEYATFHEDNKVAQWISDSIRKARNSDSKALNALGIIGEGVLPFKKTPANILRSGFEYSPLGALKSIKETGKLIYENTGKRKGNLEDIYKNKKGKDVERTFAHDVIDSWSKTLTGSGLACLGYYLFNKGILTSSDSSEKYQDQLEGKENYAININGHHFTLDWAAPGVMPLLLGAEIKKIANENAILDKEWYESPDRILETVNALLDPMFETSMLSGVKDTFQTAANEVRFNEDNAVGGILGALAGNALTGYATQAIPTLSGQIARTIDPIRRTTDTVNEGILGTIEKQGRKIANKIPFLSEINPEYRDAYGRSQNNSPFEGGGVLPTLGNLAYQMISPGYYSRENVTDADTSARQAYNGLDAEGKPIMDSSVFAKWDSTKKINGEKLNPEQMQAFREAKGQANYGLRDALAKSDWFNALSATEKTDILKSMNTLADKIGQYSIDPDSVSVNGKLQDYLDAGGGQAGIEAVLKKINAENNPYGIKADTYQEMLDAGEDLSKYEGYGDALSQLGAEDKAAFREAYVNGGEEALATAVQADSLAKEAGIKSNSSVAKQIQEAVESGDTEQAQKIVEDTKSLAYYGLDKPSPAATYTKAQTVIPNLSTEEFAKQYKAIDADGNQGIKQDEIISYLNKGSYSSSQGMQIWNAYGNSGWKKIPVLEDGTWKLKKK